MGSIEKIVSSGIKAVVPVYLNMKGNATLIITDTQKDIYVYKNIKTVMNMIARHFMIDLKQTRKYYGNIIGSKNSVPIVFNINNIFIPGKVRNTISKNDGAFGYFNLIHIQTINKKNEKVEIVLRDDRVVDVIQSYKVMQRNIRNGSIIRDIHTSHISGLYSDRVKECLIEYNKPATKADILSIKNEISKINNLLKTLTDTK
ncbi:hypothetical protein CLPU_2c01200 [Gottschalkia purinilytica]|uniref:ComK protein n=1 Tax=Gottschalkia purinilytica TaxID=1503 RepID=A0A0L0WDW8_GOTPU|nr:competence protein ComK [Gottschalkia purinilytica]KNF09669.1 hypothetical protein CLPU_2c01200 [Gottschalkia purinilytica]